MRPYIENLTNTLIGEHRFRDIFMKLETNPDHHIEFVEVAKHTLEFQNVSHMSPETLGKIMCAFEIGDVVSLHPKDEVKFSSDCELMFRQQVACFLAYAIDGKLRKELAPKELIGGGRSYFPKLRSTARAS